MTLPLESNFRKSMENINLGAGMIFFRILKQNTLFEYKQLELFLNTINYLTKTTVLA